MKRKGEARNVLLCAVLTAQLILLPVLGANVRAAGVTPDPNAAANKRPSMETAPNGVPVVNITAANGSGLSHNQYHDFNVHQQGLILNNSSGAANSQLGGIVAGNPNFHGNRGAEARTILNEVTSANRSRIEGYIEVNGRAADVILANPNGVTVNGGGFINVPRATITTGKPEVDPGGALRGYEVRQGDIRIEGAGINADNTDAFTLLARTAHVEAQVRASSLAVVTGKNSVAADGTVESGLNLAIARRVRDLLTFAGVPTTVTREGDAAIYDPGSATLREKKVSDLHNRVALVNELPGAVLLSIHQNSLPSSPSTRGAQVFWNRQEGAEELASSIQEALNGAVNAGHEKKAAQVPSSVYLMKEITAPGVLVECGFLSNAAETEQLKDPAYQTKLAAAIAAGVLNSDKR